MWHQRHRNESASRIPPKTAIDAFCQCDKNCYPNVFILLKIFGPFTDNDKYQREVVLYVRHIKAYLRNGNWTRSTEWTDPPQHPQGN